MSLGSVRRLWTLNINEAWTGQHHRFSTEDTEKGLRAMRVLLRRDINRTEIPRRAKGWPSVGMTTKTEGQGKIEGEDRRF
jgi:hypothetical protein